MPEQNGSSLELLDRVVGPAAENGQDDRLGDSMMRQLAAEIGTVPAVPKIGLMASQAMAQCFEKLAVDAERLAQDGVDRALAIQQEVQSYTAVIRQSGALLCEKIEAEAGNLAKMTTFVQQMMVELGGSPARPSGSH